MSPQIIDCDRRAIDLPVFPHNERWNQGTKRSKIAVGLQQLSFAILLENLHTRRLVYDQARRRCSVVSRDLNQQVGRRPLLSILPARENFEQTIALRQIRHVGRNRIPRDVPRASNPSEIWPNLIPVCTRCGIFGSADARESSRIEHDHAFISDLQVDGCVRRNLVRQGDDCFRQASRMIDVRGERLPDELERRVPCFDRAPVERGRNLQHRDFLRSSSIVAQRDLAAHAKTMLLRLDLSVQIIFGDGEGLAV